MIYQHTRIASGKTLYISGQTPITAEGHVPEDIGGQAALVMDKISALLASHGLDLSHVVKVTYFLTDISELGAFREALETLLPEPRPAASLVEVSKLIDPRFRVEIEAIAQFEL